jgi:hypothetical protein
MGGLRAFQLLLFHVPKLLYPMVQQPLVFQGLLVIEVGRTPLDE